MFAIISSIALQLSGLPGRDAGGPREVTAVAALLAVVGAVLLLALYRMVRRVVLHGEDQALGAASFGGWSARVLAWWVACEVGILVIFAHFAVTRATELGRLLLAPTGLRPQSVFSTTLALRHTDTEDFAVAQRKAWDAIRVLRREIATDSAVLHSSIVAGITIDGMIAPVSVVPQVGPPQRLSSVRHLSVMDGYLETMGIEAPGAAQGFARGEDEPRIIVDSTMWRLAGHGSACIRVAGLDRCDRPALVVAAQAPALQLPERRPPVVIRPVTPLDLLTSPLQLIVRTRSGIRPSERVLRNAASRAGVEFRDLSWTELSAVRRTAIRREVTPFAQTLVGLGLLLGATMLSLRSAIELWSTRSSAALAIRAALGASTKQLEGVLLGAATPTSGVLGVFSTVWLLNAVKSPSATLAVRAVQLGSMVTIIAVLVLFGRRVLAREVGRSTLYQRLRETD
ncbi:MAG: hypothetical protein K2X99_07815 [Gemmatimonadaceae bacterium]|nr:hypothetical protein [Gemmatimonadaceae bacterium]